MRNMIFVSLLLLLNCQDKVKVVKYLPDGRINYVSENDGDHTLITSYEGNSLPLMKLKFQKDRFIDTIYYFDKNVPEHMIIDSVGGPYFYGTYYLMYDKKRVKEKGRYRFTRNVDFKKVIFSMRPFAKHYIYNKDGTIYEDTQVIISNDSVYYYKKLY